MSDLISRQAAIEELSYCQTYLFDTRDHDEKISLEDAEYAIERLPAAQRWIPCSERLPEKIGDYLVSVKRHGWNCEEHIENDIAFWDDLEGFHKAEEVLAWMPLPSPYREEDANG